ncbi:hypothetical protein EYW49_13695 [Siculibacillus lacustris]|uniref:EF-hand domain-containing protein n=1 Tax=Siculibacillus lacustris TaxID=1549641 RepID=A0A4V2KTC3_9HYPH|nr:hypothetical protein [Siculibacillus lacustris]TBW36644.1 hypothetical protein EYW49_13695 [Siculibacillus lacustris]
MADRIDWVLVRGGAARKPIGAVGFLDDTAAVIVAFYADLDADKSGTVDWSEWIAGHISPVSLNGAAVVEVAMAARYQTDIATRDTRIVTMAADLFLDFAVGLVKDAAYAVYFSNSVSTLTGALAGRLTSQIVVQFAIKKGLEHEVKRIYDHAVVR